MKTLMIGVCCAVLLATSGAALKRPAQARSAKCLFDKSEVTGTNKICYYTCTGGTAAITVKSHKLCPLTLDREA